MAPHSSTLAWKIPWMEEPGRLQSMGSLRVGLDWVTSLSLFTFMHWRRKWQPTPGFLPGESQGWGSLVGYRLWGHTELDTTEVALPQQQQQQQQPFKVKGWHAHIILRGSKIWEMCSSKTIQIESERARVGAQELLAHIELLHSHLKRSYQHASPSKCFQSTLSILPFIWIIDWAEDKIANVFKCKESFGTNVSIEPTF